MTEQEERDLAWRLASGSRVLDFETALRLVQFEPAEAERLIRHREESEKQQRELERAFEGLHRAALEFR